MATVRVKICCISSEAEAQLAIQYGASALGLVSEMPSGPGVISEEQIAAIAAGVPPPVARFLLTSRRTAAAIIDQQKQSGCEVLQFTDSVPFAELRRIRQELPGVRLVQVIHVIGEESLAEAEAVSPYVDALLLDSGNPHLTVKVLGGTGNRHDWKISRRIRDAVPLPLFLAGGLRPENVAQALAEVEPFGLDLCSGVRTNDLLDERKLADFFAKFLPMRHPGV